MKEVLSRSYSSEEDLQRIRHLLSECEPVVQWYFNPNELPQDKEQIHLWENAYGDLIGVAFIYGPSRQDSSQPYLTFAVHPRARGGGIESSVITWAKDKARKLGHQSPTLSCRVSADDSLRIDALEQHGFEYHERNDALFMTASLGKTIPEPQMPSGFTVRPFSRQDDVKAWMTMWQETEGNDLTIDERLSWLIYPSYVSHLDLVAVAPDGALAAYCVCNIFREENDELGENSAWILWIGTRPAFRRRGLARSLLRIALRGLQVHGCERALLNVLAENTPAIRLYESQGFEMLYRTLYYVAEIEI